MIILSDKGIVTTSEEETAALAVDLAQKLPRPAVITLEGDLGAGKTVFSRNLAQALGVNGPVSSPTFNIVQEYTLTNGFLYHMDLYRISGDEEAVAFGIDEYLNQEDAICLIEWPQRLEWLLPESVFRIEIEHVSETERKVIFSKNLQELL